MCGAQASQVAKDLEAAQAEVAQIRQQQEAERGRVKKAIAEMKRKIDGWVWWEGGCKCKRMGATARAAPCMGWRGVG